jgi:hypothetical protein
MYILHPQTNNNNKMSITIPTGEVPIEHVLQNDIPTGVPTITATSLSDYDWYFIDHYEYDHQEETFTVNLSSAKEYHKNNWRTVRNELFPALDVAYMKALEINDTTTLAQIVSAKQELRDVTHTPLSDDLNEIKATWPSCLGDVPNIPGLIVPSLSA